MKLRLRLLALLMLSLAFSAHAGWYVDASAAAAHLGGQSRYGPFPTQAAAQAFCDNDPGYGLTVIPGGTDDSSGGQSNVPAGNNNSGLTLQQQIGGLAAQQAAINMNASPMGAAFGVGLVEGLLAPQQPDPQQVAAQQAQQQAQLAAQQLNNSGIYLYNRKDYAGAINEFSQALAQTPNDPVIAQNLANARQLLAKQQQDAATAAQNSSALGQLLGNSPTGAGDDGLTHSQIPSPNDSALNLVNLSDPNAVDLSGTTKTYVDPNVVSGDAPSAPADAQQTVQQLDNVLNNTSDEAKKQLTDFADKFLTGSPDANSAPSTPNSGTDGQSPQETGKQPDQTPSPNTDVSSAPEQANTGAAQPDSQSAPETQPGPQNSTQEPGQGAQALDQTPEQPAAEANSDSPTPAQHNQQVVQMGVSPDKAGLTPAADESANTGTDTKAGDQLLSAASSGNPGNNFDSGGAHAGSLNTPGDNGTASPDGAVNLSGKSGVVDPSSLKGNLSDLGAAALAAQATRGLDGTDNSGINAPLTPEQIDFANKSQVHQNTLDAMYAADSSYNPGESPPGYYIVKTYTRADNDGTEAVLYGYANSDGKAIRLILAFRGTVDGTDWKNNLANGVSIAGYTSAMYKSAVKVAESVKADNPDVPIMLTGHSLGGGEASLASVDTGLPAITFNAANVDPSAYGYPAAKTSQITNYHVMFEALTTTQNALVVPGTFQPLLPAAIGNQIAVLPAGAPTPTGLSGLAVWHGMSEVKPAMLNYLADH